LRLGLHRKARVRAGVAGGGDAGGHCEAALRRMARDPRARAEAVADAGVLRADGERAEAEALVVAQVRAKRADQVHARRQRIDALQHSHVVVRLQRALRLSGGVVGVVAACHVEQRDRTA
jgi:hypothetical protein